jgi:hypothetical protein
MPPAKKTELFQGDFEGEKAKESYKKNYSIRERFLFGNRPATEVSYRMRQERSGSDVAMKIVYVPEPGILAYFRIYESNAKKEGNLEPLFQEILGSLQPLE